MIPGLESEQCPSRTMSNSNEVEIKPLEAASFLEIKTVGGGIQTAITTMTKIAKNNIKLIDLGLPSGTLWADRNVGADAPDGYGDYFRFGETTPFTENSPSYKYENINENIAGTDKDAATTNLGVQFRMPTFEQMDELVNCCSRQWTQVNGVNGTMLTGPNGNSIFLPAAGYRYGYSGFLYYVGSDGFYWSASLNGSNFGCDLCLHLNDCYWNGGNRACGFPVRPING